MPVSDDKPALDAILQKVLEAVPFQLTTDGGPEAARQRFRDLPRQPVHPELRVEDRTDRRPRGSDPDPAVLAAGDAGDAPPAGRDVLPRRRLGGRRPGHLRRRRAAAMPSAAAPSWCRSTTGWHPSTPIPRPSTTSGRRRSGWPRTAAELGGDPNRLAVAGDSAGGNLAAVVAQLARDAGGPPIRFQLLWYPATTWDTSLPSFTENANAPILAARCGRRVLPVVRRRRGPEECPATLVPARAADLAGLPPAYIAVAGHDPLRDDGVRYGELLAAAGVPVEVHNAESLVHGYLGYAGVVPAATEAVDRGLSALRAALT